MSNHRFSITQAEAVTDKRIDNDVFRLLSAYGLFADKEGWCFPSQAAIGVIVGKTRQWVNIKTHLLIELGYMEKRHRFKEDGSQTSNMYRLLFDPPVKNYGTEITPPVTQVEKVLDTNAPLNDPSNDPIMGSDKSSPVAELPIEWQIASGKEIKKIPSQVLAERKDAANLIAMGTGTMHEEVRGIALSFMVSRNITLSMDDVKGNRKAAKKMVTAGVKPHHIVQAVRQMLENKLTFVDLFGVMKTAIAIANPGSEVKINPSIKVMNG